MINKKYLALAWVVMLTGCNPGAGKSETVKIYKYDGSVSCDQTLTLTMESVKHELTDHKIPVLSSTCANDGIVRAAVCGIKTGNMYVFEVSKEEYPKTRALGFHPVSNVEGLVKTPCN